MVTMKDIAEAAGLSRGTVDRVLNKRGTVNKKTEARVLEIAKQLNYTPNSAGKLLATKEDFLFHCILPEPENFRFFVDVLEGIRQATKELDEYGVIVHILIMEEWTIEQYLEKIDQAVEEGSRGIVIAGASLTELSAKVWNLKSKGIPVIAMNNDIPNSDRLCFVGSDPYEMGAVAAGMFALSVRGTVKLGAVIGSKGRNSQLLRVRGLQETLKKRGVHCELVWKVDHDDDEFNCYDAVKTQLIRYPDVNAIFFAASTGAYGGCRAVENQEIRPRVICCDADKFMIKMLRKGIVHACVCQDPIAQGRAPLHILFRYVALENKKEIHSLITDVGILLSEMSDD